MRFILSFFLFSSFILSKAQVYTGDLVFTTQQSIDQFVIDHPTVTQIDGSVRIQDILNDDNPFSSAVYLDGLINITFIAGDLILESSFGPSQIYADGLNNLTTVGGSVMIIGVGLLSGLDGLVSVGSLHLIDCATGTSLSNIEQVGEDNFGISVVIYGVNLYSQSQFLDLLVSVPGDLYFTGYPSSTSPLFAGLQSAENIYIGFSDSIFSTLSNYSYYSHIYEFYEYDFFNSQIFPSLLSCNKLEILFGAHECQLFEQLQHVTEALIVQPPSTLSSSTLMELPMLQSVGSVIIGDNVTLSANSFPNLAVIEGDFIVGTLSYYTYVSGSFEFPALTHVNGDFKVLQFYIQYDGLFYCPNLSHIGGDVRINISTDLANTSIYLFVDFPSLVVVEGLIELSFFDNNWVSSFLYPEEFHFSASLLNSCQGLLLQLISETITTIDLNSLTTLNGADLEIIGYSIQEFGLGPLNISMQNISGIINNLVISGVGITDLSFLSQVDSIQGIVEISDNPFLSNCSIEPLCSRLFQSLENVLIYNNAVADCWDVVAVIENCNIGNQDITSFAIGKMFFDINCNGIKELNEFPLYAPLLLNNTISEHNYSPMSGLYSIELPADSLFTLGVAAPFSFVNPPDYSINTNDSTGIFSNLNFPLCLSPGYGDLSISVVNQSQAIPGFTALYSIITPLISQQATDVTVVVSFENLYGGYIASAPLGATINGSQVSWVVNLEPTGSGFSSSGMPISIYLPPSVPLGTVLNATFSISFLSAGITDINPANNTYTMNQTVVGSYDPNDKQVSREFIHVSEIEDGNPVYLDYLIRFQNTGTAPAIFVRIDDVIEDQLDISSFQFLAASHDLEVRFKENRLIEFFFDNILLPDSTTDAEGSQGYVSFRIKTIGGLTLNDVIENNVGIYFDYNEPVITNTATTIFYVCPDTPMISQQGNSLSATGSGIFTWYYNDEAIPDASGASLDITQTGQYAVVVSNEYCSSDVFSGFYTYTSLGEVLPSELVVYPNPTDNSFVMQLSPQQVGQVVSILDISGRQVESKTAFGNLLVWDVQHLPQGMYMIQSGQSMSRLVIQR